MSCLEKLLPVSLLLVDVGVEPLLNLKMSSSSSSSSRKDMRFASFLEDGFELWKRSSASSSKMDGALLLSFLELESLPACGGNVLVARFAEEVLEEELEAEALDAEAMPNRPSEAKMS